MSNEIIPDILTHANKEKFRRKLLIVSRILAFILILVLIKFIFIYQEYGEDIRNRPCWSCGYYESKKCDAYIISTIGKTEEYIQDQRIWLAEYNEIPINWSFYKERYNNDFGNTFNLTVNFTQ